MNVIVDFPSNTVQIIEFVTSRQDGKRVIKMPSYSAREMGERLQNAAKILDGGLPSKSRRGRTR